jgi:hypothetical protein
MLSAGVSDEGEIISEWAAPGAERLLNTVHTATVSSRNTMRLLSGMSALLLSSITAALFGCDKRSGAVTLSSPRILVGPASSVLPDTLTDPVT